MVAYRESEFETERKGEHSPGNILAGSSLSSLFNDVKKSTMQQPRCLYYDGRTQVKFDLNGMLLVNANPYVKRGSERGKGEA